MWKYSMVSVLPPTSLGYRQGCPHRLAGQCEGKGKEGGTEKWLFHRQKEEAKKILIVALLKIFKKCFEFITDGISQLVKDSNKSNYSDLGFVSRNWMNQIGKAKRKVSLFKSVSAFWPWSSRVGLRDGPWAPGWRKCGQCCCPALLVCLPLGTLHVAHEFCQINRHIVTCQIKAHPWTQEISHNSV